LIVVDTNVLAYLWLPGARSEAAESLLGHDPAWSAPLLWRSEFRNVASGMVRRKMLSLADAVTATRGAEEQMSGREYSVPSDVVLSLAAESGCTAYDAEFVALALELGVPLVTADGGILRAFPRLARPL